MKRIATALVLIPTVVWLILAGPYWGFMAAVAITGLLAFYEFDQIAIASGYTRLGLPGMAAGIVLLLAPTPWPAAVLIALTGLSLALRLPDSKEALAGS